MAQTSSLINRPSPPRPPIYCLNKRHKNNGCRYGSPGFRRGSRALVLGGGGKPQNQKSQSGRRGQKSNLLQKCQQHELQNQIQDFGQEASDPKEGHLKHLGSIKDPPPLADPVTRSQGQFVHKQGDVPMVAAYEI